MSRAKVIFTDGFHIGPTIETTDGELRTRLTRLAVQEDMTPAHATAMFVVHSFAKQLPVTLHNTPEAGTFGGTIARMQHINFWPSDNQAGVFLVWLGPKPKVQYWGGKGFLGGPEFPPGMPQEEFFDAD